VLLIDECQVSAAQMQPFKRLSGLKHFSASYNQAGGAYSWLASFENLEGLTLVESDFGDDDLIYLESMAKLDALMISTSQFSGNRSDRGRLPESLSKLYVAECPLTSWEWVASLPNLKVLWADGTASAAAQLDNANWPPTLAVIRLTDVPISDEALRRLAELPNLKGLWVSEKHVNPQTISEIQTAAPKVRLLVQ
jgi:hypothetical protein